MIGDSVNLASRLEGANKQFGTEILISETTVKRLTRPTLLREIDRIRVKGKQVPSVVFEALGHRESEKGIEGLLANYNLGLEQYRKREWLVAAAKFELGLGHVPDDRPSAIYLERCLAYVQQPPSDDWDGVFSLTQK